MSSVPIADADDLGVFLGQAGVDEQRATALIALAQVEAESVVSPLPDDAKWTVVQAAARAYASPPGAGDLMLGSAREATYGQSQGNQTGVYLTKGEKSTLRELAGRTGAFQVNMAPDAISDDGSSS